MFKVVKNFFVLISSLFLVLSCGSSTKKLKSNEGDELEINNNFQNGHEILEKPKVVNKNSIKDIPVNIGFPANNEKKVDDIIDNKVNNIVDNKKYDNFDLSDESVLKDIGQMLNVGSTIAANGGFFNPTAVGNKVFGYRSAERVWNNFYQVSQLRNDAQASSVEFVTGSMNLENKTAYTYTYQNYTVSSDSPTVSGKLHGIKDSTMSTITIKGNLKIELNENDINVYLGDSHSTRDSIVLDNANIAQSGKLVLIYNGSEKIYDLKKLTESEKLAINQLGMFRIR